MPQDVYTLTYRDIVRRLYDLKSLAKPPEPGERSGNFSSYDRRSAYDAKTGTYQQWGANNDNDGCLRREGGSLVVLELDGPGTLWRIWSAFPQQGHLRIFIDGNEKPALDVPFRDFFDNFNDERCPANFPNLMPTLSRGRNSYIPIPFNRHCKVMLDEGWGEYYHITYTVFPADYSVPSFDGTFSRDACLALAEADRLLYLRGAVPYGAATTGKCAAERRVTIPAGGKVTVWRQPGPGAVSLLQARVHWEPGDRPERILRELTLSLYWDGADVPDVWAPMGDFFGAAAGVHPYRSLPLGMSPDAFYSRWYMPFEKGARLEVANDGETVHTVSFCVGVEELPAETAGGLLRFHAKWHRDAYGALAREHFAPGGDRWPDWPLLLAQGPGRFCGVHLHVYNAWASPTQEPETWWYGRWDKKTIDWWWGEGDEKFFVDGENFPSTFGTGSEDYIGYGWAAEPPFPMFDSAFACQPFVELDANGNTSVDRFHICDNIPFSRSFQSFMEKYKENDWDGNACLYAATVYWYQAAGRRDAYPPQPLSERIGYFDRKDHHGG